MDRAGEYCLRMVLCTFGRLSNPHFLYYPPREASPTSSKPLTQRAVVSCSCFSLTVLIIFFSCSFMLNMFHNKSNNVKGQPNLSQRGLLLFRIITANISLVNIWKNWVCAMEISPLPAVIANGDSN